MCGTGNLSVAANVPTDTAAGSEDAFGLAGARAVVALEPMSDFFLIDNTLTTGSRRYRRFSVSSSPAGDRRSPQDSTNLVTFTKVPARQDVLLATVRHPGGYAEESVRLLFDGDARSVTLRRPLTHAIRVASRDHAGDSSASMAGEMRRGNVTGFDVYSMRRRVD